MVEEDRLVLVYTNLDIGRLWDSNPKEHDIGLLIQSIWEYGFRDPPHYSETLGGFDEGNGRTTALWMGKQQGLPVPRGVYEEGGEWYYPVLYGMDFADKIKAKAWAIDHNNIQLMTIAGVTPLDASRAWKIDPYLDLLQEVIFETITVDPEDLVLMRRVIDAGVDVEQEKNEEKEKKATVEASDNKEERDDQTRESLTFTLRFEDREDLLDFMSLLDEVSTLYPGPNGSALLSFLIGMS